MLLGGDAVGDLYSRCSAAGFAAASPEIRSLRSAARRPPNTLGARRSARRSARAVLAAGARHREAACSSSPCGYALPPRACRRMAFAACEAPGRRWSPSPRSLLFHLAACRCAPRPRPRPRTRARRAAEGGAGRSKGRPSTLQLPARASRFGEVRLAWRLLTDGVFDGCHRPLLRCATCSSSPGYRLSLHPQPEPRAAHQLRRGQHRARRCSATRSSRS